MQYMPALVMHPLHLLPICIICNLGFVYIIPSKQPKVTHFHVCEPYFNLCGSKIDTYTTKGSMGAGGYYGPF
jgi:hypothetical protein